FLDSEFDWAAAPRASDWRSRVRVSFGKHDREDLVRSGVSMHTQPAATPPLVIPEFLVRACGVLSHIERFKRLGPPVGRIFCRARHGRIAEIAELGVIAIAAKGTQN